MNTELTTALNKLAKQLGLAIDFTSKNAVPYIKDLIDGLIHYKINIITVGLVVSIIISSIITVGLVVRLIISIIKKTIKKDK